MNLIKKILYHGIPGSAKIALNMLKQKSGYIKWKYRHTPVYANPTEAELEQIEQGLLALGIELYDYAPPSADFLAFQAQGWFPLDYHGGLNSGVWDEKLLEHWISSERLGVMRYELKDIYVDIAAAGSPWAQALRERKNINAYAIDLYEIGKAYRHLDYYRVENATASTFADDSISGASLHCAYEMFMGKDDTKLIKELARILKPGGKVVILPLYMHTNYCSYSTPEYFGKGYSDPHAREYLRLDCGGVPSSRKYDPLKLKERVLDPISAAGLNYKLSVLRNKNEFGKGIYCHFILEIEK
jgi:hypothetical protein